MDSSQAGEAGKWTHHKQGRQGSGLITSRGGREVDSSQAEEAGKWMYHIKEAKKLLEGEQTKSGSYVQFIIYIITNKTRAVQAVRHMLSHFLPLSRSCQMESIHALSIIYIITNKTRAVQAVRHMLSHFLPLSRWHHYQCLHHLHSELFAAQANASSS